MNINDFISLIADPKDFNIELFDSSIGEQVYAGKADKVPYKYLNNSIFSFDSPKSYKFCININTLLDKEEAQVGKDW